jgi:hypothetical protein
VQERVHHSGRPVAGFGVGAPSAAEAALRSIRVRLGRPTWGRGVGITSVTDGGVQRDAVLVSVRSPEHVPIAQMIVGDRVNGVRVIYEAVGDFYAQGDDCGVGALWSPAWRDGRAKLAAMEWLVAAGRGDEMVEGGGCTEPGGGIVPTQRTAREMAELLRGRAGTGLRDAPVRADTGLGHLDAPPPSAHPSPWKFAVVTSLVSVATGWVLEEVARRTFRKRRRYR